MVRAPEHFEGSYPASLTLRQTAKMTPYPLQLTSMSSTESHRLCCGTQHSNSTSSRRQSESWKVPTVEHSRQCHDSWAIIRMTVAISPAPINGTPSEDNPPGGLKESKINKKETAWKHVYSKRVAEHTWDNTTVYSRPHNSAIVEGKRALCRQISTRDARKVKHIAHHSME